MCNAVHVRIGIDTSDIKRPTRDELASSGRERVAWYSLVFQTRNEGNNTWSDDTLFFGKQHRLRALCAWIRIELHFVLILLLRIIFYFRFLGSHISTFSCAKFLFYSRPSILSGSRSRVWTLTRDQSLWASMMSTDLIAGSPLLTGGDSRMASAAPLQCPTRQTRIYIVCDVAIDLILELIGCACDGAPLHFEEPAATASVQLDNLLVH